MTELLLVRHARPRSGGFDPELDEVGRAQAHALAAQLAGEPLTAVVCSDLRRACETAEIIAAEHDLVPTPMGGLREWGLPADSMEYVALESLAADHPGVRALDEGRFMDFVPKRVDVPAFQQVVRDTFDAILEAHPAGRVAVVCHGGTINAYVGQLVAIPDVFWFHPDYTSVSRLERRPSGRVVIRSLNEAHHLLVESE
ncbi:histidine phosphatase family protein [Gordonia sp. HNM0687]|uniref:Histidine phosphatase family protein n=1 Tax=Gordonia mangrovi TaxID=2665643 RepID=A0A6L7GJ87_9ACTN|nr:histidine phosphatase family protein [Gordonia mangrovi]MXP20009.1 histidine phosphatase family protein [Gordonia mangrovi]UVF79375.1 histidine phosphatase family protein [Gordonia mangrovi]